MSPHPSFRPSFPLSLTHFPTLSLTRLLTHSLPSPSLLPLFFHSLSPLGSSFLPALSLCPVCVCFILTVYSLPVFNTVYVLCSCVPVCVCVCVCVCLLWEKIRKCRVGKAFVGTTWAAAQHPCSLCLETPVSLVPSAYSSFRRLWACCYFSKPRAGHQGVTHILHCMVTGFGPFNPPTRGLLRNWAGPLPLQGVRQRSRGVARLSINAQ